MKAGPRVTRSLFRQKAAVSQSAGEHVVRLKQTSADICFIRHRVADRTKANPRSANLAGSGPKPTTLWDQTLNEFQTRVNGTGGRRQPSAPQMRKMSVSLDNQGMICLLFSGRNRHSSQAKA